MIDEIIDMWDRYEKYKETAEQHEFMTLMVFDHVLIPHLIVYSGCLIALLLDSLWRLWTLCEAQCPSTWGTRTETEAKIEKNKSDFVASSDRCAEALRKLEEVFNKSE